MTTAEMKQKLNDACINFETLSKRNDTFTLRRGFFYTHGESAQKIADKITTAFPKTEIIKTSDVWKSFNGGASLAKSSHFLVVFKIKT